jgi:hypothetical protein
MITREKCLEKEAEYEQLAARCSDPTVRSSFLMMAKRWRNTIAHAEPSQDPDGRHAGAMPAPG